MFASVSDDGSVTKDITDDIAGFMIASTCAHLSTTGEVTPVPSLMCTVKASASYPRSSNA